MNYSEITNIVSTLIGVFGTRDPFRLAKFLDIEVMFCDDFASLKGMYSVIQGNRFIFINNTLDCDLQRVVCAHELGHDQLHRTSEELNTKFNDLDVFNFKNPLELEANLFASELLIDTDEIIECISHDFSIDKLANHFSCDKNLIAFKINNLKSSAYEFNHLEADRFFLK